MDEKLTAVKGTMAAFCMSLGTFLGWQGIMALVWVGAMGLDYLSGSMAACRAGQWSSAAAREGLWHKGGMILVVAVAAVADVVINHVGPVIGAHSGPGTLALFYVGSER